MHTQQPRNLCPFRFTGLRFDQGERLGELLSRERIDRFRLQLVGPGLVEAQPGRTQHQACRQHHRYREFVYSDQHGFQRSFQEHGRLSREDTHDIRITCRDQRRDCYRGTKESGRQSFALVASRSYSV